MKDNINSDKIIWSDAAVEELRTRLTDDTIEDDEDSYGFDVPEDLSVEVVDYEEPPVEETYEPVGTPPESTPASAQIEIQFPWPISVKSNTVWYGADMKSNDDVTLTFPDVTGVDDYEVRITRT